MFLNQIKMEIFLLPNIFLYLTFQILKYFNKAEYKH